MTKDYRFISVYGSGRHEDMYVFMPRDSDPGELPEPLRSRFGAPRHVMDLVLRPDTRLARADTGQVIEALQEQGFYLQMPPRVDQSSGGRNDEA